MTKKNILILGDGFLGNGVFKNLSQQFNKKIFNRKKIIFYLKNEDKFIKYILKTKIKFIINCIGNTKKNLDLSEYIEPNIKIPTKILKIIKNKKIVFVNFASQDEDSVIKFFENKNYPENSKFNYAISKYIFTIILKNNLFNNYILNLKIPIIFGYKSPKHMLYGEAEEKNYYNKYFTIKNPNFYNNFIFMGDFVKLVENYLKIYKPKKYRFDIISNNKPQKVYDFIKLHFPDLKIKLKSKLKQKIKINKTLKTKNKFIINYFK